jgi:hypothetical protein
VLAPWHFLVHLTGCDYGLPYGHFSPYDFWSGVAGSFVIGALVFIVTAWLHQTCHHSPRCLRRGRHPAAGGMFRLCWKHHPDMGKRPHPDLIRRLHREHQERTRKDGS